MKISLTTLYPLNSGITVDSRLVSFDMDETAGNVTIIIQNAQSDSKIDSFMMDISQFARLVKVLGSAII